MAELSSPSPTAEHREIWARKPVLRALYGDYQRRLAAGCVPGRTLEVGGGSGNLKGLFGDTLSMDIQALPWLDLVADAHRLPFAGASLSNIVMVDVLHHLEAPALFFAEVVRVLVPGGRVVMVEPAITPLSWIVYRFMHPEPVRLDEDPLAATALSPDRDPFDSNQAAPTTLFGRHRRRFEAAFPELRVRRVTRFAVASLVLSGGFRPWSLLPAPLAPAFLALERLLDALLGWLAAFRVCVVLERRDR